MWTVTPSPIGDLRIVARDGAITAIEFSPFRAPVSGQPLGTREDGDPLLRRAVDQLAAYFAGDLTEFDLPLGTARRRRTARSRIASARATRPPGPSVWPTGATRSRS